MTIGSKKELIILFLGDLISLALAFWLALAVRAFTVPSYFTLSAYAVSLVPLSILWIFTFFIAGLYEKHAIVFEKKLPGTILNAQIANSIIAVIFFYFFAPYFSVTPKTVLVLYLVISTALIVLWRFLGLAFFGIKRQENAILIGSGEEMRVLLDEVNANKRYNLKFVSSVDLDHIEGIDIQQEIVSRVYAEGISSVVIDLKSEKATMILPVLYNLIFSNVRFFDMHKVYEEVFSRAPLSLIGYSWFLENISQSAHIGYDSLKKLMDITIGAVIGIVSLALYPIVIVAIKLEDGGEIFSFQKRVGQNNKIINIAKFRTMKIANDDAAWSKVENKVTKVGAFLRKTRIDELPQLWNVLKGDISLIGPRPEFERAVKEYSEKIPYYNTRHIIKPGLSGWAQLYHERHPHHGLDIEETRNKLSYDLYYIKNRSFVLDLEIALKTIRTLLSRTGV
ncbi:MAG: exopolysaccharide biosynthesis polyprenyl glycosylphosphotransferase [Patescibacteria group bacterium]